MLKCPKTNWARKPSICRSLGFILYIKTTDWKLHMFLCPLRPHGSNFAIFLALDAKCQFSAPRGIVPRPMLLVVHHFRILCPINIQSTSTNFLPSWLVFNFLYWPFLSSHFWISQGSKTHLGTKPCSPVAGFLQKRQSLRPPLSLRPLAERAGINRNIQNRAKIDRHRYTSSI